MPSLPPERGPVGFAALAGKRIALWGWGREGHAAWHAIRARLPALPLTLFCNAHEAGEARALGDAALEGRTDADGPALAAFQSRHSLVQAALQQAAASHTGSRA